MINLENPVRAVILTTTSVVAGLGINAALRKAVEKVAPNILSAIPIEEDEDGNVVNPREIKEILKESVRIFGVSVAVAIVAGLVSSAIVSAVDDTFWPTDFDVEIDPTIE